MIFAYWDSDDSTILTEMISAWRGHFPEFRVLSNHDIVPLIERRHSPPCADLFNRIRLPSAKSDIARFVALYEFGGLYVDCLYPRPPGEHFLISAPIFGRRHSEMFMTLAQRGFSNLAWQQHLEEQYGYVFYDVARLVGPTLINEIVLEPGCCTRDVKSDFAGRIMIVPEETNPMVRNFYTAYKTPENHWTTRQLSEPVFEPVRSPTPSRDVHFHNLFQAEYRAARARIRAGIEVLRQSSEEDIPP
jgi:hypothetical protein